MDISSILDNQDDEDASLEDILNKAMAIDLESIKHQLNFVQMVDLADAFIYWAMEPKVSTKHMIQLVCWAKMLGNYAETLGPTWNPPEPEALSLFGSLGRMVQKDRMS